MSPSGETEMLTSISNALPDGAETLSRCQENNCRARSSGLVKIVVKGESIASADERATDCIFFVDTDRGLQVVLSELKSGAYHVREVLEKLEASERHAKRIAKQAGVGVDFIARTLFAGGANPRVGTPAYVILVRRGRVRIRRCGSEVSAVLAV